MKFLFKKQKNTIYLDYAAATPIDPQVRAAMQKAQVNAWYNPNAIYGAAIAVRNRIEQAREHVARLLHARPSEIIFTDGATEANNLGIAGAVKAWKKAHPDKKAHVITTKIEHASVLDTCRALAEIGVHVDYLSVDEYGHINIKELKKLLNENTVLVSIGYANGEIGTVQDIREIAKTIRHFRKHTDSEYPYFHTDAVQAVNYEHLGVPQLGVDLMTINAAKIYGPKKSGLLYVKTGTDIEPVMFGGSQEFSYRPGTENLQLIVGMEESLERALKLQESESIRLGELRHEFISNLKNAIPDITINGNEDQTLPNIVNISVPDISSEEIVLRLDAAGIMASVKSACKAGEDGDSHVILAIRGTNLGNTGSIRFSMGRSTSMSDLNITVDALSRIVANMRETRFRYQ
jgi:cysteine desulfurase